ncbi:uncharacterized protein LOC143264517 [Megachile rotundata]|uniref:uncharacterized protein LOC143264517 n=1 Tax=Megachile rotundata TaxID=143995 RepID=UPI003FCF213D
MSSSTSVRIEPLGKDNYDTWKIQVEALLIKNDNWKYVNGNKIRPDVTQGEAATQWDEADAKARSDLILAISPSEIKQIKNCKTSNEIWKKLEGIYQSKGPARKATLLKQLALRKMAEGDDVRSHMNSFFDAVDKLKDMEVKINPDMLAVLLLYSLPGSFENFRVAIESRDEYPTPEALKIKILEESAARTDKAKESSDSAMWVRKLTKPDRSNTAQWKRHDTATEEPNKNAKEKLRCFRCKKIGHRVSECRGLFRGQRQSTAGMAKEDFSSSSAPGAKEVAFQADQRIREKGTEGKWCLDSGCSSHMSGDASSFVEMKTSMCDTLNLASSASTQVEGQVTESRDQLRNDSQTIDRENSIVEVPINPSQQSDSIPTRVNEVRYRVGRPRIIRTGSRGRPRKVRGTVETQNDIQSDSQSEGENELFEDAVSSHPTESAGMAEIPLQTALSGPDETEWRVAIREEIAAMLKNDVWEIVERPRDREVIGCRMVLRDKINTDGQVTRRKARLVARGFAQRPGLDYEETHAPVTRLSSIRLIIALAVEYDMQVHQLDVSTAYLNGEVDKDIFMTIPDILPDALRDIISDGPVEYSDKARKMLNELSSGDKVCKIKKALYGLKQAGRQWNKRLDEELRNMDFVPLHADPCVYILRKGEQFLVLAVYVDDIVIAAKDFKWLERIKKQLMQKFETYRH